MTPKLRKLRPNLHEITVREITFVFSYEILVIVDKKDKQLILTSYFSKTTNRHIKFWLNSHEKKFHCFYSELNMNDWLNKNPWL